MPASEDWLEKVLRKALAPVPEGPGSSASEPTPVPVPDLWWEELLARVAQRSSDLLAQRIREQAEEEGWNLDDLAEEASDCAEAARNFLQHGGDPQRLTPAAFAHLFQRVELIPSAWKDLLRQAVSAFATIAPPQAGTIMGRTTGLSGAARAEALGDRGKRKRDPDRAARAAELFVDEVMSEWRTLMSRAESKRNKED